MRKRFIGLKQIKKHIGIPPSTTLSILDAKEEPTAVGHELPEGHLV